MARKMTKKGFDEIQAEINRLWTVERPEVVEECYEAAQLGDRSENAAYIYGKKRLRQIDSRLGFLRKKVKDVTVVNTDFLKGSDRVEFGALVTVEDDNGTTRSIRLVDQDESDPKRNRISVQSPVGRALLGQREGDIAEVNLPKGKVEYEIIEIHYGPDPKEKV